MATHAEHAMGVKSLRGGELLRAEIEFFSKLLGGKCREGFGVRYGWLTGNHPHLLVRINQTYFKGQVG
jgi:hypothetical protein